MQEIYWLIFIHKVDCPDCNGRRKGEPKHRYPGSIFSYDPHCMKLQEHYDGQLITQWELGVRTYYRLDSEINCPYRRLGQG